MNRLVEIWPNLVDGLNHLSCWNTQWRKHGSCSKMEPLPYFTEVVQLYDRFPISTWLAQNNIRPSETTLYSVKRFTHVLVQKGLKREQFQLVCYVDYLNGQKTGVYFMDLRICLNVDLRTFTTCPIMPIPITYCIGTFLYLPHNSTRFIPVNGG